MDSCPFGIVSLGPRATWEENSKASLKEFQKTRDCRSTSPDLTAPLRRAANEAAALAWLTPYALLVFPTLLEEKAQAARHQTLRQAGIRRRSRNLLAED